MKSYITKIKSLFLILSFWIGTANLLQAASPFVTTWQTNNSGTSNNTSITIPTNPSYTYNYDVDWNNDGIFDDLGVTGNITHDYGSSGSYQIAIKGTFPAIYFNDTGDSKKIISINQWGDIIWQSMNNAFLGTSNLGYTATDAPDLTNVTDMSLMFSTSSFNGDLSTWDVSNVTDMSLMFSTSSFNGDLSTWDVSNVTDMSYMFHKASSFNGDLSTWDVSSVDDMAYMFSDAAAFNSNLSTWNITNTTDMSSMLSSSGVSDENYDNILIGWAAQSVKPNVNLGASGLTYCSAVAERNTLTNTHGWTITGDVFSCPSLPFITTWQTDNSGLSNNTSVIIPTNSSYTYNYDVDWNNDGTFDDLGVTGDITHDYGIAGSYQVAIRGTFPAIYFNGEGDKEKITSIDQWGDIAWETMRRAFYGCTNMGYTATDTPDFSSVTDASYMFYNANAFNVDLSTWDVSNVTDMAYMFFRTNSFNGDLSTWDVSNVTDMNSMFSRTNSFNGDLSTWDVSNVTDMAYMFYNANDFNGNLSTWDVSNVTEMNSIFSQTNSFNGDLSTWDVSNVTDMNSMFSQANSFNSDLSTWDVSNVTDMNSMFSYASSFNGDLSTWDVSNVTDMNNMFSHASSFNVDLSTWDVSNVTSMGGMFSHASSFNVDLSTWDVSNVTSMSAMFSFSSMSTENYDNTLIGWAAQTVQSNVDLGAGGGLNYCYGETARNTLINTYGWNITGDVLLCSPFITTWQTDNPGTFNNTSIIIPTDPAYTYNYDVDWNNDGTFDDFGLTGNSIHDYGTVGSYQVAIRGTFPAIYFNNLGDKEKITSIDQWGSIQWQSMNKAFYGCINLTYVATDNPNLNNLSNMAQMFNNASSFNADLSNWNISNISDMADMLDNSAMSLENYDNTLIGWAAQTVQSNVDLGADGLNYCNAISERNILSNTHGWNITGDAPLCSDIIATTWNTNNPGTSNNTSITIPTNPGNTYNYDVDWNNDGTFDDIGVTGNITHDYGIAGSYQVAIRGTFPAIYFNNGGDKEKITSIDQWGDIEWQTMNKAFYGCSNLEYAATDTPDLSVVSSMDFMFSGASSFDGDLSTWDVSNVTTMDYMFQEASSFDGDLSTWNVANVSNMTGTFRYASSFDGDLSTWDVANVTKMNLMFSYADSFNGDLSTWNVANVDDMSYMFAYASFFNSDLNSWNVINVENMKAMFAYASLFNSDLNSWNVINVSNMSNMFQYAIAFNGNLSNWNVANVSDMGEMFNNASSFNGNLSTWNVANVINMAGMFGYANLFNSNLTNWNVVNVNNMTYMFNNAIAFNNDLTNWNVSNVTDMHGMFYTASSFDRNLANWNISNVADMTDMFSDSGMSLENYDNTLIGWANQTVQPNVDLGADGLNYCNGETARNTLINSDGWNITGDVSSCPCETPINTLVNVTSSTTAIVTWDAVLDATNYQVKYRIKGTSSWTTVGSTSLQRNLPNLSKNKYYQYKVRANCGSGWSNFSDIEVFYTSICDIIPTGIAAIYLDNSRMRIRWDNIDEVKAKVRYREVGTSTWYTQNSADGNNYVYINDLTPNATYQYRVRSNCEGNNWSAYSASYFHDLSGGGAKMAANESVTAAKIYPNPVNDLLNIEFETNIDKKINIIIINHLGKVIHSMNESYSKGMQRESIDVSSFANGYYFISIQGDDMMETFKFVKIK